MKSSHTLLIGRGTVASTCLDILKEAGHLPACIICDTSDTGSDTWTRSLWKTALRHHYIPEQTLFKIRNVNNPDFLQLLQDKFGTFSMTFSLQPYALFRMPFLRLSKQVVNMHFGPLPQLRGVAPCSWAFVDKVQKMGVTLHLIKDEGIDNGPIIAQYLFPIKSTDTAETLFHTCTKQAIQLFNNHFLSLLNGMFCLTPQNEEEATYHPLKEFRFDIMEIPQKLSVDEALNFAKARIFPAMQTPYFFDNQKQKISILNLRRNDKLQTVSFVAKKDNSYILSFTDGALEVYSWFINSSTHL